MYKIEITNIGLDTPYEHDKEIFLLQHILGYSKKEAVFISEQLNATIAINLTTEQLFKIAYPLYDNKIGIVLTEQDTNNPVFLKNIPGHRRIDIIFEPKDYYYDNPVVDSNQRMSMKQLLEEREMYQQRKREFELWQTKRELQEIKKPKNVVTCPYCNSTKCSKIGTLSRMFSTSLFGVASSKIGKQWHCNNCKSDF